MQANLLQYKQKNMEDMYTDEPVYTFTTPCMQHTNTLTQMQMPSN